LPKDEKQGFERCFTLLTLLTETGGQGRGGTRE